MERLGRFSRILTPGINCLVPFLDAPKQFKWSKAFVGRDGRVKEAETVVTRVDLRETLFNFPRQDVYTVDTVQMSVSADVGPSPLQRAPGAAPASEPRTCRSGPLILAPAARRCHRSTP